MTLNYPGPYEIRMNYHTTISGVVLSHQQRLNLDVADNPPPGTAWEDILGIRRDTTTHPLDDLFGEWVELLHPLFSSSGSSLNTAELWRYEEESFSAVFIAAANIGQAGTSGGGTSNSSQAIWTFRTVEGGIMKVNLMESIIGPSVPLAYAAMTAAQKAVVDYILSSNNPYIARDTSFPIGSIALYPGQSEVLFKKRFSRPS